MLVVASVEVPVTTKDPVVVAFPKMTFVRLVRVATRLAKNPLVEVELVEKRLVTVPTVVEEVLRTV